MKKNILLLTLIILTFLLVGTGSTFQNEPDGFRDLKWGDPPTEDMIYFTTAMGTKVYTLPNDKMYIGNARFYAITYIFYGKPERLMAVTLLFSKENNFDLLKTICRGRFGEETEEGFYNSTWMGLKTAIYLSYDIIEEKGDFSLISIQILAEKTRIDKQKEIEKSKEDW